MSDVYVTFGGDTAGLESSVAVARATVNRFTRELASLSRELVNTGASAESELGQKLLASAGSLDVAKKSLYDLKSQLQGLFGGSAGAGLEQAAQSLKSLDAAAAHGGAGLGLYLREFHALADELSSGRYRNAESTFLNLSVTFLQSRANLIPFVAAAAAAAAGIGYLGYQIVALSNAVKSIELDAVVAQFGQTDAQAKALVSDISRLADVGSTAAAEIAKPFLALGSGGEILAKLVSPYLPMLAKQMGEDAPKAAAKLAEMFAELGTKGRAYVTETDGVGSAQLKLFDSFVASGETGKAWGVIVDALRARSESFRSGLQLSNAALEDQRLAAMLAGSGLKYLGVAEAEGGTAVETTTAKIRAQESELSGLRASLEGVTHAQAAYAAAARTALEVDRLSAEIAKTKGQISTLDTGLGVARFTNDREAIDRTSSALQIAQDHLKKLQEQAADGLLGRDAMGQADAAIEHLKNTFKGAQVDLLKQQQAVLQSVASNPDASAGERAKAAEDVLAKQKEIDAASYADFKASEDLKVAAAGKNSAAIIAIREQEAARAREVFGAGSNEERAAIEAVARAKEQAANRGAAAATKAAKDELGATEEGIKGQIAALERHTAAVIDHLGVELKLHQITMQQEVAAVADALQDEQDDADAYYSHLEGLAGLSKAKRQEFAEQQQTLDDKVAEKTFDAQAKAAEKTEQAWDKTTKAINSAFDSQISGLLRGTETLRTAFKNVAADLTEQLIKSGLNSALTGFENTAKSALGNLFGQGGSALTGGAGSATGAAATTANTTALGALNTQIALLISTLTGHAVAVGVNTAASVGNTTATSVDAVSTDVNTASTNANTIATNFQAAMAAITSFLFPAHAEGTPFVQDTGLALIHKGEAVIPAAQNPFRGVGLTNMVHQFDFSDLAQGFHAGGEIGSAGGFAGRFGRWPGGGTGGGSGGRDGGDTHNHNYGGVHIDTGGRELDPDTLAKAIQKAQRGGHFNRR